MTFDREYFEQGPMTGKSLYTNYRWMPELTIPLCHHLSRECPFEIDETILDFGCAKGYITYALRLLGYKAWGVDISEYAISQAPKEVNGYVEMIEPYAELSPRHWNWIICKDILEHIPYDHIDEQLQILSEACDDLIAMVPLGDGMKYNIEAYEHDVTHHIREPLEWWNDKFTSNGFGVDVETHDLGPFKSNWQGIHPEGNGLFMVYSMRNEGKALRIEPKYAELSHKPSGIYRGLRRNEKTSP